jgi:hypothetical protein
MRDIYNPPPAPVPLEPAAPEPLSVTRGDVLWLVAMLSLLGMGVAAASAEDLTFGLGVLVGGLFVILESWFSGLTFLRRHDAARTLSRWLVFGAALMPWLIGLGFAAALMLVLFSLSDPSARLK